MTGNVKMQKQQVYFEDEASMYCSSLTVSYVITSAHGNVTNTVVVSLSDILTFLLQEDSVVSSKMEVTTCSSALTAPEKMAMSQATIEATG
ncbi:hypothetical protein EB796_009588 [Bugula neritina]|uniref:Uncharacterized protein n=1 Tax=Bugula neritina TaxID=10212 RepID=A0A7J7K3C1_BUGNE|nr:hypothetical protein EB796_009588 [Bugula neritina]